VEKPQKKGVSKPGCARRLLTNRILKHMRYATVQQVEEIPSYFLFLTLVSVMLYIKNEGVARLQENISFN
jgi:hypothetical protein